MVKSSVSSCVCRILEWYSHAIREVGAVKFAYCKVFSAAAADRMVWPPSLSRDQKWPRVTKYAHSWVVCFGLESSQFYKYFTYLLSLILMNFSLRLTFADSNFDICATKYLSFDDVVELCSSVIRGEGGRTAPDDTIQGADTRMKLIFCGWIDRERWKLERVGAVTRR